MPLCHSLIRSFRKPLRLGALALKSGMVALILTETLPIAACAQVQARSPSSSQALTVRPREMATGTRTERAGDYQLDSLPKEAYWAYVPPSCVGTRRCPLVVYLLPGDYGYSKNIRVTADDHGTLVLFVNRSKGPLAEYLDTPPKWIDIGMKQMLRQLAVDPDRIAIIGNCATAVWGTWLGDANPGVFNRVVILSGMAPERSTPRGQDVMTEWFWDQGIPETPVYIAAMRSRQRSEYAMKTVVSWRGHSSQWETYDFLWRWLHTSWTIRDPAKRPAPRVMADPLPVLTAKAVAQLTAFWTRFQQEPESVRTAGRRAHLQEVVLPLGDDRPSILMMDMPAMAAAYPSVAAALKAAGLTAQEHDAYRLALASARIFGDDKGHKSTRGGSPMEMKNRAFLEEHPDEIAALQKTAMWMTP